MSEANAKPQANSEGSRISSHTLMPIGLAVVCVLFVASTIWALATDRQLQVSRIQANADLTAKNRIDINRLRDKLDYLTGAMIRIETKLGTLPRDDSNLPVPGATE
jgi:hypothetical protein